jgi:hypothetical protein
MDKPRSRDEMVISCATADAGLPDGIFLKPNVQTWVNFGGSCNGRCLVYFRPFGLFGVFGGF